MKNKIGELLLQIIPVMIGVYLVFVISDWSDTRKNESQVSLFRTNLIAGIESNKSRIEAVIDYHNDDFCILLLTGLMTSDFEVNATELKKLYTYLSISMTDVVLKENELIEHYDMLLLQLNSE